VLINQPTKRSVIWNIDKDIELYARKLANVMGQHTLNEIYCVCVCVRACVCVT